ncbi:MAG TPA: VOC family protein [Methanomassiliicoccales archaeon]|nr:VOC family protein [Methanomassiliicoccales archaeon]
MPRVEYFEINADDPQRAMGFYEEVFGWSFERWKGPFEYWLARTGEKGEEGIDGGILRRTDPRVNVVDYIGVKDIDDLVRKIVMHRGTIVQPKTAVPGVGWVIMFRDTEGNILGAMQEDDASK